jgi:hypothetical protein
MHSHNERLFLTLAHNELFVRDDQMCHIRDIAKILLHGRNPTRGIFHARSGEVLLSAMAGVLRRWLQSNRLSGTLPASWAGMTSILRL